VWGNSNPENWKKLLPSYLLYKKYCKNVFRQKASVPGL
jgi:hypothetical protein